MTEPILRVDGLTKRFGDFVAVDDLSFTVAPGEIVGLLGGNGAGKTTTLAMLLGLLLPSAGRIEALGVDMARDRHRALAAMNFTSPYVDLPHRLTVRQNLLVFARLYGVKAAEDRLATLGRDLDLAALMERRTGSLSAGQRTRLALAKALINAPRLVLLDEPTASLDPDTGDRIRYYLGEYARESGAAMLLASHNMSEVERLCHRVLLLRQGRLIAEGTPAALIDRFGRSSMEEVFLDVARGREAA